MGLITFKQTGGKQAKPYITKDPNDPRIQAYLDSLSLYLNGERNYLKSKKEVKAAIDLYDPTRNKSNMLASLGNTIINGDPKPKYGIRNVPLPEEYKTLSIAPTMRTVVGDLSFKSIALKNLFGDGYIIPHYTDTEGYSNIYNNFAIQIDRYKKPVQPVVYKPQPQKTIKKILNTKLQTQTPQPEQPKTPLIAKKPIQYKEEKVVMKVRVPNPERMDLNRNYNQAGNTHEEERVMIRRVPITENDKTTLSK